MDEALLCTSAIEDLLISSPIAGLELTKTALESEAFLTADKRAFEGIQTVNNPDIFTLELEDSDCTTASRSLSRNSLKFATKSIRDSSRKLSDSLMAGLNSSTNRTSRKMRNLRAVAVLAASKAGSLKQISKSIKKGVARFQFVNTKRLSQKGNLVICIDAKGDRLNPSDPVPPETPTNSNYEDEESDSGIDEDLEKSRSQLVSNRSPMDCIRFLMFHTKLIVCAAHSNELLRLTGQLSCNFV